METENTTVTNDEPKVEAPKLTVSDLQQLAVIVDVSFRKGVFNAEEAAPVSAVYAKLVAFLRQFENAPAPMPASSEQPAAETKE